MSPAPLQLYAIATRLLEPLAPVWLHARARRGKEDLRRLSERLGVAGRARPPGALAWLHGASVGESLSLLPLIEGLRARRPGLSLLVTSGTVTAATLLGRRLPSEVVHQYAPLDMPGAAARFLASWRPDLGVFVESEIWPNLLTRAKASGARLALVSARLSEASARGWARIPASARSLLGAYDLILPQDDEAAERFSHLGARIDGRLNLKRVGSPLPFDARSLEAHRRGAHGRPILLAASTHPGEDALVLTAFESFRERRPVPNLVIVPRHPERGRAVAELARAAGYTTTQQGVGEPFDHQDVHVADLLGELGLWFRLSSAAFMGGSWADGVGGHNPLEPARLGCPAASGPHVANWRSVYDDLAAEAAVRIVPDPDALAGFWTEALDHAPAVAAQAERARAFTARQSGALETALDKLDALL